MFFKLAIHLPEVSNWATPIIEEVELKMKRLSLILGVWSQLCLGWGEVGHHLIARSAVELLTTHRELAPLIETKSETAQSFLNVFRSKQYQQGHLANIPDTYWRNLDHGFEEDGNLLGSPSHYFDAESFLTPLKAKDFSSVSIPLSYAETKRKLPHLSGFFREGSLPWRAQQFTDLYQQALSKMVSQKCTPDKKGEELTREVLTYAGLMAHFTGDVSMPYHASIDHDAIAIGQKGIHGYFENDLVSELELSGLYAKVVARAEALMRSPVPLDETPSLETLRKTSKETYPSQLPNQETSALMMAVLADSFSLTEKLRQLDYTYAIATLDEALKLPYCQNLPVVLELKNQYDKLEKPEQKMLFGKVKVLSQPSDF
ncbi:MAG: hypothetical protein ACKOA8_20620, partial [Deltaproteobacteria bacterium]